MSDPIDQQEKNVKEWEDAANWRFGIFYYSPKDTRPWVPKRSMFGRKRFGGTPNFAIKSSRRAMMILIGVCVLVILLVANLENSGFFR